MFSFFQNELYNNDLFFPAFARHTSTTLTTKLRPCFLGMVLANPSKAVANRTVALNHLANPLGSWSSHVTEDHKSNCERYADS